MLQTSLSFANQVNHLFTTRFSAWDPGENVSGHQQAVALVQALPPGDAVIFAGDFNAKRGDPQLDAFEQATGLKNAFYEVPDPAPCDPQKLIDHVVYRGPYRVVLTEVRCPWGARPQELSEHPWIYVELISPPVAASTTVPDVTGMPEAQAAQVIQAAGLVPQFSGPVGVGARVMRQTPTAGTTVTSGTAVTLELTTGPTQVTVPDVEELSLSRASTVIRSAGLVPQASGSGAWVSRQSPRPGTTVPPGSSVTLTLRSGRIQ